MTVTSNNSSIHIDRKAAFSHEDVTTRVDLIEYLVRSVGLETALLQFAV